MIRKQIEIVDRDTHIYLGYTYISSITHKTGHIAVVKGLNGNCATSRCDLHVSPKWATRGAHTHTHTHIQTWDPQRHKRCLPALQGALQCSDLAMLKNQLDGSCSLWISFFVASSLMFCSSFSPLSLPLSSSPSFCSFYSLCTYDGSSNLRLLIGSCFVCSKLKPEFDQPKLIEYIKGCYTLCQWGIIIKSRRFQVPYTEIILSTHSLQQHKH